MKKILLFINSTFYFFLPPAFFYGCKNVELNQHIINLYVNRASNRIEILSIFSSWYYNID